MDLRDRGEGYSLLTLRSSGGDDCSAARAELSAVLSIATDLCTDLDGIVREDTVADTLLYDMAAGVGCEEGGAHLENC